MIKRTKTNIDFVRQNGIFGQMMLYRMIKLIKVALPAVLMVLSLSSPTYSAERLVVGELFTNFS